MGIRIKNVDFINQSMKRKESTIMKYNIKLNPLLNIFVAVGKQRIIFGFVCFNKQKHGVSCQESLIEILMFLS